MANLPLPGWHPRSPRRLVGESAPAGGAHARLGERCGECSRFVRYLELPGRAGTTPQELTAVLFTPIAEAASVSRRRVGPRLTFRATTGLLREPRLGSAPTGHCMFT